MDGLGHLISNHEHSDPVQSWMAPPLDVSFSQAHDVEVQKRFPVLPFTLRAIEDEQARHEALPTRDKSSFVIF